ncbi:NAD-dependent epimerase/dehydratase family protein [Streptomyces sp. NPDC000594]|uniref:NAD-dependent epimerase/dehydratase family protein n=1 Tax=Streptomyces sp. NPDC000594 TaxID=3154261 RepID=UPI0033247FDE
MTITLVGATGFVGGMVLRELLGRGARVRAIVRTVPLGPAGPGHAAPGEPGSVEWVRGDLTDPASLRGVCAGSDVLLQLASYIGPDTAVCEAVNVRGTEAVVSEARRAGVGRLVQLSTTAVYGTGPHRDIEVGEVEPDPVSAASASRLRGERPVLEAGGTVLRPGLVLGAGDRWVVPAIADALRRVPARWDGGRAVLSLVDVADLARLIATVAMGGPREGDEGGREEAPQGAWQGLPGGIHHAGHPLPVSIGRLISALARYGIVREPEEEWPLGRCLARLEATPGWVSPRQFTLLAQDHWYRSERTWRLTGVAPSPDPLAGLAGAASWYRDFLRFGPCGPV